MGVGVLRSAEMQLRNAGLGEEGAFGLRMTSGAAGPEFGAAGPAFWAARKPVQSFVWRTELMDVCWVLTLTMKVIQS